MRNDFLLSPLPVFCGEGGNRNPVCSELRQAPSAVSALLPHREAASVGRALAELAFGLRERRKLI